MADIKTGLWKKVSKNGNTYLGGSVKVGNTEYWIKAFKNDIKRTDLSPDWNIVLTPKEAKAEKKDFTPLEEDIPFK